MLIEISNVKQIEGEPKRRWFNDDFFDLVVWLDDEERLVGFQLAYGKPLGERALTWRMGSGYRHDGVDDGESKPGKMKSTPILVDDGIFNSEEVAALFKRESCGIDRDIAGFVYEKLKSYRA